MSAPGGSAPSSGVALPSAARPAPQARGVESRATSETASRVHKRATPADFEPLVLGPGTRFEGILTFDGFARVAGEIRGEIICTGTLQLDAGALVEGNIEGDALLIAGEVRGEAIARERIELAATARVRGAIRAPRLALAEGCVLDGPCYIGTSGTVPAESDSATHSKDPDSA